LHCTAQCRGIDVGNKRIY